MAQSIARSVVGTAEQATFNAYKEGDYIASSLQTVYLNALKSAIAAFAGRVTATPGVNIIINPKNVTTADYSCW